VICLLLVLACPQESDAAARLRAELERIRGEVRTLMDLRERLRRNDAAFRNGSEDEEALKKLAVEREALAREFQERRDAAIRAMDALLASATEELGKAPADPGLLEVRAEARLLYDRRAEALEDFEKLGALRPEDAELALKTARLQHGLNRYEAAARSAERVLAKDAAHVEARTLLGLCRYSLHRFDDAARLFESLLQGAIEPEAAESVRRFHGMAVACREAWTREEALRAREARADDLPRVTLTTSRGEIELELFENEAPNTVANFVELVDRKFYDGLTFHRVIPNFMAQGGCPRGDGSGDPGYRFKDELGPGHRLHFRGSISMANSGPDTNGSQFFITHFPTEWLNGKHTVFGRVLKGQEVVDALAAGDKIVKAEVTRRRDHPYKVVRLEESAK
jgi:cyclophilin family peptidyl-prolyl cis-trans isomerase